MPVPGWRGGETGRARQVIGIFLSTFVLATAFSFLSEGVLRTTTIYLAGVVLVIIILVGILFDVIGLATATASHVTLNAMAAKRAPGARQALRMARNASRVATICNDLVGDICGTVSGAAGAAIVFRAGLGGLAGGAGTGGGGLWSILAVALIAAITVGGKALGKSLALRRADEIVYQTGRVLWWLEEHLGLVILRERQAQRRAPKRRVEGP